ncbi:hypothetical protein OGAPHI_005366 [Ogataea philodendri]|uniref:Uncharacterized protein n=1 Tax=Ogataea philodendri TaxID=1378263 RepID=A0A9P8T288_9ASCO|nr:uncharacterized protein OGAPHI_005366 [Ogataea philodendri]KAH3663376.1 hypothetical protein OGAPHI_005366 [Ogataea philodendri]
MATFRITFMPPSERTRIRAFPVSVFLSTFSSPSPIDFFTTAKSPLTSSFCSTSSSGLSVSAGLDSSVLGAEKLKLNVEVAGAAAAAAGVDPKLNGLAASAGLGALAPKLNPLDGAENENTGLAGCDSSLASGLVSDGLENENADDEPNENAGVGADAVSELGSGSEAFGSSLAGALNENAGLANADSAGLPNEKAGTAASAGLDWPKVNAGFSAGCSAGCSVGFAAGSSFFGNLNTSSFI